MYSVYFAGELFDHKHITGNALLAQAIKKMSQDKYSFILPQDWEGDSHANSTSVRNRDIESVMRADFVLFNFDGPDIDSGTVVEFMVAKMIDVPAVVLRTDCRNGAYLFGDNWNLMMSAYPRVHTITWEALIEYNQLNRDIQQMHTILAQKIIAGFETVSAEKPVLSSNELLPAYEYVVKICGGDLDTILPVPVLQDIITAKAQKIAAVQHSREDACAAL